MIVSLIVLESILCLRYDTHHINSASLFLLNEHNLILDFEYMKKNQQQISFRSMTPYVKSVPKHEIFPINSIRFPLNWISMRALYSFHLFLFAWSQITWYWFWLLLFNSTFFQIPNQLHSIAHITYMNYSIIIH